MSEKANQDVHEETGYTITGQDASLRDSFACRCVLSAKAVVPALLKCWVRGVAASL